MDLRLHDTKSKLYHDTNIPDFTLDPGPEMRDTKIIFPERETSSEFFLSDEQFGDMPA